MYRHKISILVFLLQIVVGQSINNAVGLGNPRDITSASTFGIGSIGLVPSYSEGISLDNPVTWASGRFALLSSGFGGEQIRPGNYTGEYGFSDLYSARLILPIKNIYALGLSIKPVTNNNYWLVGETTEIFLSQTDTLPIQREINGSGGINSFRFAFSFPLSKQERNGVAVDILFGSARHNSTLVVDGTDYIFNRHDHYSGVYLKYYLYTNRYSFLNKPTNLYGLIGLPLRALTIKSEQFHLFEDVNSNGYYDYLTDYPYVRDDKYRIISLYKNIQKPISVELGCDIELKQQFHIMGEIRSQSFNSRIPPSLSPVPGAAFNSIFHINLGAIKFARELPREWHQYFHSRAGIYFDSRQINNYQENLNETGLTLGIGFNFGPTDNQIDIAYSYAKRHGPLINSNETIERFKIQMTIGDIWFVKRRAR